jgi:dihydrofolate reductase
MGRVTLTKVTSADGYVSPPDGGIWDTFGWPDSVQLELNTMYGSATAHSSTGVGSSGVYEMVLPFWIKVAAEGPPPGWPMLEAQKEFAPMMAAIPKVVVSRTIEQALPGDEIVRADPAGRVRELRESGDVLVLGGGQLVADLIDAELLDELYVIVEGTVLGAGRPLIGPLGSRVHLKVLDVTQHSDACHVVRYEPARSVTTVS